MALRGCLGWDSKFLEQSRPPQINAYSDIINLDPRDY
jgi:hypothetical protein